MLRRHPQPLAIATALLIAMLALLPGPVAAQETTSLQVGAILCQDADCIDHDTLVPGFTITALDSAAGDTLATCTTTTDEPQTCTLELPADADWTLDWGEAPDRYTWRGDLYPVADGPFGTATLIPFVPSPETEPTVAPIAIEEPGHVTVQAALCADASCQEITEFLDLFIISAVDPDTGEELSSCATGNATQELDRQCILDVPHDGNFALTWVPDQVPAGYAPLGEPFQLGDPGVLTLGFYRVADHLPVTPSPAITTLPTTGAGPGVGSTLPTALPLTVAALLLGAISLRSISSARPDTRSGRLTSLTRLR